MSKETIKRKIAALRAKTEAAGCTESEALAAAALASKLMQEHGLSEAEIEFVMTRKRVAMSMPRWQRTLVSAICAATNTHGILCTGDVRELEFAGKEHAVEVAIYLRDVLTRAVNAEIRKLKQATPYRRLRKATSKSGMVNSFAMGMVRRLSIKLRELFAGSMNEEERTAAIAALDAKYNDLKPMKTRKAVPINYNAYFAGERAGDAVQLSHGVGGSSSAPLMIGGA